MLATALKEGTKKSHTAAENTKFVSSFLRGVLDPEEYRKLLTNFYYVYDVMEFHIKNSDDPRVKAIYYPELERKKYIEEDLEYYYGPEWRDMQEPSEAAATYFYRIHEVAEQDPYLLIAHHYTRYIGDLSGGQILRNIAEKALKPPKGAGLMFYEFPRVPDPKAFKTEYRAVLDELPLDESQKNAMIAEANYAFRLNMYLFDEIQSRDKYPLLTSLKGLWKVATGFIGG